MIFLTLWYSIAFYSNLNVKIGREYWIRLHCLSDFINSSLKLTYRFSLSEECLELKLVVMVEPTEAVWESESKEWYGLCSLVDRA